MANVKLDFTSGTKNPVTASFGDFKAGLKLYLFGAITAEYGQKALQAS